MRADRRVKILKALCGEDFFFFLLYLMKNVQRRIHYFAELSECDKRGAEATEGREAALHRGPGPVPSYVAAYSVWIFPNG